MKQSMGSSSFQVITAQQRWPWSDLRELGEYRDLLIFLVRRSIKVRYAQSVLGFGWAIVQPVAQMLVFTVIFGRLVGISSDGEHYAVFAFVALVPWTYFSNALNQGTASLSANTNLIRKIYFPRLILPLSEICARLVDFCIAFTLLLIMLLFYGVTFGADLLVLPLLMLIMLLTAAGGAFWLSALSIQYRDINYASGFLVQLMMYASPVVYSVTLIPAQYQHWYALNPMVGVIDGFRAVLLGANELRWDLIAIGSGVALVLFLSGIVYFHRRQEVFADVG